MPPIHALESFSVRGWRFLSNRWKKEHVTSINSCVLLNEEGNLSPAEFLFQTSAKFSFHTSSYFFYLREPLLDDL